MRKNTKLRRSAQTTSGPAMTLIANCYNPSDAPGAGRQVEIRRDNRKGWFVCATLQRGEVTAAKYRYSDSAALEYAAALGYTDVLRQEAA